MKKVFGLLAIVSMVLCVSCKGNTTAATEEAAATEEVAIVDETVAVSDSAVAVEATVEETPAE